MPQKFGLYEDLTVMENLNLSQICAASPARHGSKLLLACWVYVSWPVYRTPGGQALRWDEQKLGLACTLVGEPKVLLLDDPASALTLSHGVNCGRWFMSGGRRDVNPLEYLVSRRSRAVRDVLLMNEGELLYQGEPTARHKPWPDAAF